jgi:hypothetical protein
MATVHNPYYSSGDSLCGCCVLQLFNLARTNALTNPQITAGTLTVFISLFCPHLRRVCGHGDETSEQLGF